MKVNKNIEKIYKKVKTIKLFSSELTLFWQDEQPYALTITMQMAESTVSDTEVTINTPSFMIFFYQPIRMQ